MDSTLTDNRVKLIFQEMRETINSIVAMLEKQNGLPADPESPDNEKMREGLQDSVNAYFRKVRDAFPYSRLGPIYNRHIKESVEGDVRKILDPILVTFGPELESLLYDEAILAYLAGSAQMITYGETKLGIPIAYEGPPMDEAINYARQHVTRAKLVDGINLETRKQISNIIERGIANKRGIPGIARDIRQSFDWMIKGRSELGITHQARSLMIARTETCEALQQAFLDRAKEMGIEYKEWVVQSGAPCPECQDNDGAIVKMDEAFPTGVYRPPQHPNCMCACVASRKEYIKKAS